MIAEVIARHEDPVRATVLVSTHIVLLDARVWERDESLSTRMVSAADVLWVLEAGEWRPSHVTVFSSRPRRDGTPSARVDQQNLWHREYESFFATFPEAAQPPKARVTVTIEEGTA